MSLSILRYTIKQCYARSSPFYLLAISRKAITDELFPKYCFSTKPPTSVPSSAELPTEISERNEKSSINSDEPIYMKNPYKKERRLCILCKMNITPNYKNVRLLSQFQSPYTGRIYGRHITGLCRRRQEQVELEIIRSQSAGYMGVYNKGVEFLKDSQLFNPEKSIRPHKY